MAGKFLNFAKIACAALAAGAIAAGGAAAHHSYAMFDRTPGSQKEVSGTIRTVQWTNPHVYLWIYAPDQKPGSSEPVVWGFEFGGGPNGLVRQGWRKDTLKPGDKVTVKYAPLKDGGNGGAYRGVTMLNGKPFVAPGKVNDE